MYFDWWRRIIEYKAYYIPKARADMSLKLSKEKFWALISKHVRSPGIDSKESIPPAYVAWRAGATTLFPLGS